MNVIKKLGWRIILITSFILFLIGFYDTEKSAIFWSISLLLAILVEKYGYELLFHKFEQRTAQKIATKRERNS